MEVRCLFGAIALWSECEWKFAVRPAIDSNGFEGIVSQAKLMKFRTSVPGYPRLSMIHRGLSAGELSKARIGRRLFHILALSLPAFSVAAQLPGAPSTADDSNSILWTIVALAVVGGFTWFIFRSGSKCSACGKRHALEPTWEKNDRGEEQWRCRNCGDISWKEDAFRKKN